MNLISSQLCVRWCKDEIFFGGSLYTKDISKYHKPGFFLSGESVVKYLMYQSITGGEWPQGLCWGLGLGVAAFPTSVSPLQVTDHLLVSASDEPGPLPQSGGPSWLFFRSPDSPHLLLTPHMLLRSVGTLMYSHTGWFVLRSLVTGSFHCYPGNLHGNSSGSPPWITWEFLDPFYS